MYLLDCLSIQLLNKSNNINESVYYPGIQIYIFPLGSTRLSEKSLRGYYCIL